VRHRSQLNIELESLLRLNRLQMERLLCSGWAGLREYVAS